MNFITGGTGLLGSHIAEQLVQQGEPVRALVRLGGDAAFLQSLNAELHQGRLEDVESLSRAMAGAEVVYHAACKVGDWGPWRDFQRDAVDGTRHVLEAATAVGVRRVVLISSTSAYGHPKPRTEPIRETEPLGDRFWFWDHYTRAKVMAERIAWDHAAKTGLPISIIRPGWLYGPRDRTSIHRIARALEQGRVRIIGAGTNRINSVYAGNVAEASIRAARQPAAVGQAYNITNDGVITQREYLDAFADALGYPRPFRWMPYRLAFSGSFIMEAFFRALHTRTSPFATRYAIWLLGRDIVYCTAKAECELGWKPTIGYEEGIRRTAEWYKGRTL